MKVGRWCVGGRRWEGWCGMVWRRRRSVDDETRRGIQGRRWVEELGGWDLLAGVEVGGEELFQRRSHHNCSSKLNKER